MTRRRRNIFREASAQVEGYRDKGLKRLRVERIKGRSVQTVDVIGRRVCGNRLVEALLR